MKEIINKFICLLVGHIEGKKGDNGDANKNWRRCLRCKAIGWQNLYIGQEIDWKQ